MASFQIFPEANLGYALRGHRCGDVSHQSWNDVCSHNNRYFVYEKASQSGIFVHAGCEDVKLERRRVVGPEIASMLDVMPRPTAYRNNVGEDGVRRFPAPSMAEIEEVHKVVGLVLEAQERAQAPHVTVDQAPPPAPKPQPAAQVTFTPTTTDHQLSDVQMMDNFLSGPSPPLTQSNLERAAVQGVQHRLSQIAHRRKPRTNPYDLLTGQRSATKPSDKPNDKSALSKVDTLKGFLYEDGDDHLKTGNLPPGLTRIDLTDKPALAGVLMDYLLCRDLCHEGSRRVSECKHNAFCLIVHVASGVGALIHKDNELMTQVIEEKLKPEHLREVYKALNPGRKAMPQEELTDETNIDMHRIPGLLERLGIASNPAGEAQAPEKASAAEPNASAPIDIKTPSTSAALEFYDPMALKFAELEELEAKISESRKALDEVMGKSKLSDSVKTKATKTVESKSSANNSSAASKEVPPRGTVATSNNQVEERVQSTPEQLPSSRIPKSKPEAAKQVEQVKVAKTAAPKAGQKVAQEDEDGDWETVDRDEAIESEYAFI